MLLGENDLNFITYKRRFRNTSRQYGIHWKRIGVQRETNCLRPALSHA